MRRKWARMTCLICTAWFAAAAVATERAIDKEVVIAATPEQAWDAWTTRAGITSFFAPDAKIEAKK